MKILNRNFKPLHLLLGVIAIVVLIDIANAGFLFGKWLKFILE
ncbi:hypothetical protein [Rufibacter roseus]